MTPELLMPEPAEARFYGLTENHSEYRRWWSVNVMKQPDPSPIPGVLDVAVDPELG